MPRVHTQKAGKDYPEYGIAKGDTYYWWKFRYGGKRKSKTYPRSSQLTQSEYLGWLYDFQEDVAGKLSTDSMESLEQSCQELKDELQEKVDELQEKLDSLPENFQYAGPGEIIQERIDSVQGCFDTLDSLEFLEDEEHDEDEKSEAIYELVQEIESAVSDLY